MNELTESLLIGALILLCLSGSALFITMIWGLLSGNLS